MVLKVLTRFQLDQAETGHKVPLDGMTRKKYCPPCSKVDSVSSILSCRHVLECGAVQEARDRHGVTAFMDESMAKGYSSSQSYEFFVNGLEAEEVPLSVEEVKTRGAAILEIFNEWRKKW